MKSFGLFADQDIPKGSFLCIYAGELISTSQARDRSKQLKERQESNYILVMKEVSEIDGQEHIWRTTVDSTRIGNIGRFMSASKSQTGI